VAGVLYYRLYYMDRFSGHIDHFREFEAEGDSAAIEIASGWANGGPMELWNRHRKLKRWDESIVTPD
jgi:hypothetical protein